MSPYPDESRPSTDTAALVDEYLVSDPRRLLARTREVRDSAEKKVRAAKELAAQAKSEVAQLKQSQAALTRQLGSSKASLEASRNEIQRLKADLKRVRSSRSMRIGKAVLAPLQLLKGKTRRAVPPPQPRALAPEPSVQAAQVAAPKPNKPVGAMDLAELEHLFETDPTPQTLAWVMSRQWFQHGMVTEPARLLARHPELVNRFEPQEERTAARILGTRRLLDARPTVPERNRGMAYLAEPGRVMYCVHSTPAYSSNGYSTRTRGVAGGLAATGREVIVVARAGYPWDSKVDTKKPKPQRTTKTLDHVSYVHVPGANLNVTPPDVYLQVAVDAFVREARLNRPEVIQAASNHLTALPALIAARRLGVPFVYEVRGLWEVTEASDKPKWNNTERYQLSVELESMVAREADTVLAITPEIAEVLITRGVDPQRITVAPNAVDPSVFVPLPRDTEFAWSHKIRTDVPVIGFAGSIVSYEGLDHLLNASRLLTDRGVDHQVVIAGSGAAEPALKEQRSETGISNVLMLGRLPMEEMPRLLSTFDIMPCPRRSLPVTELVSPLKPLESFGSGKAVVLSDLSPHRTFAGTDQSRALLVPDGDVTALADALERLIRDADLRADLGRAGRLWVVDERNWANVGATMSGALASASEHHKAHASSGRALAELRVGIIADEFTTSTLAPSVQLVPIQRGAWRNQVENERLDLMFVESAWKGNEGQWHRGVGHYSDEESSDIRGLLAACRDLGIPTVFWNKEDPVHFARFRSTAAACDHVFTTDASMIEPYLTTPGGQLRTASGLPFYAQPAIHNPLPSDRPYEPTVAYAGTYYGERYADRSRQLDGMLDAALDVGLTIYDRQLGVPGSPYHFPSKYAEHVRGVLPYEEVIKSYRSHVAHINVNSVTDSPTMFSRRVVEVAASGGIVLSGPGRGLKETLGVGIASTSDPTLWQAYLYAWASDPLKRLTEQWRQMRTVYRAHTIDTALTLVARTAGVPVTVELMPKYGALVEAWDTQAVESLVSQSVRPSVVHVMGDTTQVAARLEPLGIPTVAVRSPLSEDIEWVGRWQGDFGRTHAEDLLTATRFGHWDSISFRTATPEDAGEPLARRSATTPRRPGLVHRALLTEVGQLDSAWSVASRDGIEWIFASPVERTTTSPGSVDTRTSEGPKTILVAGHDLKFARGLITDLEQSGHTILIDEWSGHNVHDEAQSTDLLRQADVIFCEWGLGNLAWYSHHVADHQRLVTRIHLQEIDLPYLRRTKHSAVDAYLFVGELIRQAGVVSHGVPVHKAHVVPNYVDIEGLWRTKDEGARFNLGLVGIVPQRKRLDLALDVLEGLLAHDDRYRLFIKGYLPSDYPWMAKRPDEMAWYDEQFSRAAKLNDRFAGSVVFDGFGADMAEWYQKIGVALSVSDFESFHFTIADGAASGAVPASLAWGGADLIYPREWLAPTVDSLVERVLSARPTPAVIREGIAPFDQSLVLEQLRTYIVG